MSTHPLRGTSVPVLSGDLTHGWRADLSRMSLPTDDAARVELLRGLEELKSVAAAVQARVAVDFDASQRAAQEAAGVDRRDVGRGIAAQIGLARRDSAAKGARHLGFARALVGELPHTLEALTAGETSEWRAILVARETACLSREDRLRVDAELAGRPGGLGGLGDRGTEIAARGIAYRLDPYAATRRARKAEADRRVSLRPAPDTMSNLTGLLPVRQGVAAFASLSAHADSLRAAGDPRSWGQIMADTFVERLTGQATADAVPLEVQIVMGDQSLIHPRDNDGDCTDGDLREAPAWVAGYGPVPAPLARTWIRDSPAGVWLQRLFADPETGELVAMESRRRTFNGLLRAFIVARDQVCRTPWCDAPIRQVDHVIRAAEGGPTSAANGQGLCTACNLAREAPGWVVTPGDGTVHTSTPTGHRNTTGPPAHRPKRRLRRRLRRRREGRERDRRSPIRGLSALRNRRGGGSTTSSPTPTAAPTST